MSELRYRPNVAAIIKRDNGKILVGERSNIPGAWQFPQGGIKKAETPEQALVRELKEEISLQPNEYRIMESKGPYRYLFEKDRVKEGFNGQEQTYFLLQLDESKARINVWTDEPEFSQVLWIEPSEFNAAWVPPFKRAVYRQVLFDFFGITL
jgi:putative (di)nucleoside polyphosphate hydrolase